MKKNIAIITSGYMPLPPVKGGAVEALVQMIADENEKKNEVNLTIFSVYDEEAEKQSLNFKNTNYIFFKIPALVKLLDLIIYFICKNILKKKKSMSYRYIIQRIYCIRKVAKIIRNVNYDELVFENHATLLSALGKYRNFEKYKGRYYYHAHNEITNEFGNHKYLMGVKQFICVSQFIADSISKRLGITDKSQFIVLRNKVDEQKFRHVTEERKNSFRKKYHIPTGYTLFTFSGRLNPEKGVKELLLAYKKAHPQMSKLIIAGGYFFGSNLKSDYEVELAKIGKDIYDKIIFTGNIDYNDMPCLYAVSDVMVLPSIWNDPAPLAVIESITAGKPLITTYSGGIPEYADKKDAIILPINDQLVENLASSITKLAEDRELRRKFEEAAKRESQTWTKESFYEDFVEMVG